MPLSYEYQDRDQTRPAKEEEGNEDDEDIDPQIDEYQPDDEEWLIDCFDGLAMFV